jgi:hypothetical protein
MTGVLTGFNSRTSNQNGSQNTVLTSNTCGVFGQSGVGNWTAQLTEQQPWYLPDIDRGHANYPCGSKTAHNFGTQESGDYHFTVILIDGSDSGFSLDAAGHTAF